MENFSTYLTYSDEDLQWQLTCTNIGSNEVKPGTTYPPNMDTHPGIYKSVATGRTLSEYQIIYITKGKGRFVSEGKEFVIIPGTVIFLFPGIRHAYKPDLVTGWNEFWVGFRSEYFDALLQEGVIHPAKPVYYIGLQDIIIELFTTIFDRVKRQRPCYQFRVSANIIMLLAEIISFDRKQEQGSNSESIISRVKCIFQENIHENIDLEMIAEKLHLSTSYLNEKFKAYTGMTPYQYYLHLKVNKAKELLETGDMSIKELSFKLGFEDQYYFSRLFKKKTGVPPSQWNLFHQAEEALPSLDKTELEKPASQRIGI